ncbi:septum formation initiator [Actinophytocola sp.]|uniref:septum formation initiator n=1 Tax=Actinophytocola sp. TaxID=1872138 RepID=UPI00389A4E6C
MTVQTESTRARKRPVPSDTVAVPETEPRRWAAPGRSRTAAAQRAYARRAQREGRRIERPVEDDLDRGAGRVPFAVLIIVVLTVGVAATLWLSTQAAADSYHLEQAKQEADRLSERAAQLQREVTEKESAASLAERAKAMGMVPAGDPARLIVQSDGTVVLVGEPKPVQAPTPTPPPTGATTTNQPGGQTQDGQAQSGQPTGGQPAGGQQGGPGQGAG